MSANEDFRAQEIARLLRDGGPVHPLSYDYSTDSSVESLEWNGMTLRDYFIAHAPAEVPEWFLATMTWECPLVPAWNALTLDQRNAVEQLDFYDDERDFPGRAEAVAWVQKRDEATKGQQAWQAEFRRECTLQWPLYWADEMLKRRAA